MSGLADRGDRKVFDDGSRDMCGDPEANEEIHHEAVEEAAQEEPAG